MQGVHFQYRNWRSLSLAARRVTNPNNPFLAWLLTATLLAPTVIFGLPTRARAQTKSSVFETDMRAMASVQQEAVSPMASAVINFAQLSEQEAFRPLSQTTKPKAIHPPMTIQEPEVKGLAAQAEVVRRPSAPGTFMASHSPQANFLAEIDQAQGGGSAGTFNIPPDTTGAIGLNHVMVNANNNYKVQSKTDGSQLSLGSITAFWAATGAGGVFDPRIVYDPYNDRWIVAAVAGAQSANSAILVGVSQTSDPQGSYFLFAFDADSTNLTWADFPMLGFNKNWVTVTVNMFTIAGGTFSQGRALVLDYPSLRGGAVAGALVTGIGDFCLHPATTYSATENTLYLVTHLSSAAATYRLSTITGTPAAPTLTLGLAKIRTGGGWATHGGNSLPQQCLSGCPGTLARLDSGDVFIRGNVVFRHGFGGNPDGIWYAQTVALPAITPTHTAIQWTKINTSGNFVDGGRIEDPTATVNNGGKWYAYPTIAVNKFEHLVIGFSEFESDDFADAGYAVRFRDDAPGSMRDPVIYKEGEDYYDKDFGTGRQRWGDYSHTQVDPSNDSDIWTIQEYARLRQAPTVGGSNSKWGTWWANVPFAPTRADVQEFSATSYDSGQLIEWQTSYESDNLGFNVYKEIAGKRVKLNPHLLAGSALAAGPGTVMASGRIYSWWDGATKGEPTSYWLEEFDLRGNSIWHGPVLTSRTTGAPHLRDRAVFLSAVGNTSQISGQTRPVEPQAKLRSDALGSPNFGAQDAVKISISAEGWYRVSQPELLAAGLSGNVSPHSLQLFVDGQEQPICVTGASDGRFDAADAVEFYGLGLDTPSTKTRVYWLVVGKQKGKRIGKASSSLSVGATRSFLYAVERKDRGVYFTALANGDKENFFGSVITAEPIIQTVTLGNLDAAALTPAQLDITLQGVTFIAHQVNVRLNGYDIGDLRFDRQASGTAKLAVPHALLREGENQITLMTKGGQSDISLVNTIRLTYAHTSRADNDALSLMASGKSQIRIEGFTSRNVRVFDVTDSQQVSEIVPAMKATGASFAADLTVPGIGQRRLLAITDARIKSPDGVRAHQPSNWQATTNGADLLVITRSEMMASFDAFKALREAQGISVAIIDVEDVYDEFNFGHKSPAALRDFIAYAKNNWRKTAPRYVLLAGDASLDPKNYLGYGDTDFVPTKLIDTSYIETASDDWFIGGREDLAIGRLPVRSAEEAAAAVAKLIAYERTEIGDSVLLVADRNDGYDFERANDRLRNLLPAHLQVEEIRRGQVGTATAKQMLLDAIDRGQRIINYNGHGSSAVWQSNLLTVADARALTNGNRLPLIAPMTCLNGFFHDPVNESLAEALLLAEGGGAIAVWASTTLAEPADQSLINEAFYRILFDEKMASLTLGEVVARAKRDIANGDVKQSWILFGDPSLRLKR